eukprot:2947403-Pleurochrysis_carterae.AAC.1
MSAENTFYFARRYTVKLHKVSCVKSTLRTESIENFRRSTSDDLPNALTALTSDGAGGGA